MSGSVDKSSAKSFPSVQVIVLAEIAWAVLALLFFLLFSVSPVKERPLWYSLGTSIFEIVAFFGAGLLCFRNWRSPQIVSGRNVWLGIGLGMFSYFLGSLLFTYWETFLGRDAAVSPGDFFYLLTYIFLGWGMALAVVSRRLNLSLWQWSIVAGIAVVAIFLAVLVSGSPESAKAQSLLVAPAQAQSAPASPKATRVPLLKPTPKATAQPPQSTKAKAPIAAPTTAPASVGTKPGGATAPISQPTVPAEAALPPAPEWVTSVESMLDPLKDILGLFYVIADVFLLIIATTLLLAFWGGRFSLSWRVIAAAAFSLYIADMWFKYATTKLPDYQSGSLPEVFWIFSAVLFGVGAALEYDLSSRSRRAGGRRKA